MYGNWKNIQLNMRSASQIVQKFQGELIFYEPPDIGSPLALSQNGTLSQH